MDARRDLPSQEAYRMADRSANEQTIIKLFAVYSRQGISKHKAIMLIAASLGVFQKDVLEVLDRNGS